jgi:monoamine oxidase
MVKALAETLDVRLNQTVEAIQWDEERAKVQAGGQTYEADYVIVTLPLGVLKRGSVTFDPPLPPEKQTAIETLGMGLLNKAYLRFPSVFWDDETWIANMAAAKTGWTDMLNLAPALGEPLLLVFNSGSLAAAAEAQSDEQIVADIMAALRAIYGPNIPDPTAHSITRWNQDPFAYGSYSFMAVGAEEDAREVLAAPLEETLFFAGEATENDHPATVHGALMSGWRAAEELIEIDG